MRSDEVERYGGRRVEQAASSGWCVICMAEGLDVCCAARRGGPGVRPTSLDMGKS